MPYDDTMHAAAVGAAKASLEQLSGCLSAEERARLARHHHAFQRARVLRDPDTLLLCLLFYVHANASLRWALVIDPARATSPRAAAQPLSLSGEGLPMYLLAHRTTVSH